MIKKNKGFEIDKLVLNAKPRTMFAATENNLIYHIPILIIYALCGLALIAVLMFLILSLSISILATNFVFFPFVLIVLISVSPLITFFLSVLLAEVIIEFAFLFKQNTITVSGAAIKKVNNISDELDKNQLNIPISKKVDDRPILEIINDTQQNIKSLIENQVKLSPRDKDVIFIINEIQNCVIDKVNKAITNNENEEEKYREIVCAINQEIIRIDLKYCTTKLVSSEIEMCEYPFNENNKDEVLDKQNDIQFDGLVQKP